MTPLWTREVALAATGGRAQGPDWQASGVSIDTRTLEPGDLFVALTDVRDGHDFVANAFEKGAAAALVSRVPEGLAEDAPLLLVEDVLAALEHLGAFARDRTTARVVAVTGSVGKTSTKEMLRHMLRRQGRTHAAEASYNNHWGVPLTLARMPENTEFAVIEIGMNHPGEIAPLACLARPHVAIVTTVAPAHLEAFESIEGIAREKASIFEGLEAGGIAIYNADVETAPILAEAAVDFRSISFGVSDDADVRVRRLNVVDAVTVVEGEERPDNALLSAGGRTEPNTFIFKVGAAGRHFGMNALAALIAVEAVGADWDIAASDLARWHPPSGRGQRETLVLDAVEGHSIELIDDAFNANPASMVAAFEVLAGIEPREGQGRIATGRRIAILGDMLELGPTEAELHRALADHPAMASFRRVDCVGPRMRALFEALPAHRRGRWVETAEELAAEAHKLIDAGDVVLVKGSKGSRVSLVVDALRRLHQAVDEGTE